MADKKVHDEHVRRRRVHAVKVRLPRRTSAPGSAGDDWALSFRYAIDQALQADAPCRGGRAAHHTRRVHLVREEGRDVSS